jgi:hypothetical protein
MFNDAEHRSRTEFLHLVDQGFNRCYGWSMERSTDLLGYRLWTAGQGDPDFAFGRYHHSEAHISMERGAFSNLVSALGE